MTNLSVLWGYNLLGLIGLFLKPWSTMIYNTLWNVLISQACVSQDSFDIFRILRPNVWVVCSMKEEKRQQLGSETMALVGTSKSKYDCKVFIVCPCNVTINMKTYWYYHLNFRKYKNTTNEAKLLYILCVLLTRFELKNALRFSLWI